MTGLILALAGIAALAVSLGHSGLAAAAHTAAIELRALRLLHAALAGAALAVAGALMQGLLRNPLADPSVLGVGPGANLGAQVALLLISATTSLLPAWFPLELAMPLGAILGAILALSALLLAARRAQGVATVVVVGLALASLFTSLSACLSALAQDAWTLGRALVALTLGGVGGKGAAHAALAAPLVVIGIIAAWAWGRGLDVLLAGEDEAAALGLDVRAARRWVVAWTAVLVAAAVAVGGGVGFVGLVVPHLLRPLVGSGHRRLIPAVALAGALIVAACDVDARVLPLAVQRLTPHLMLGEIPLGVITGLFGAPVFLWVLWRARRQGEA